MSDIPTAYFPLPNDFINHYTKKKPTIPKIEALIRKLLMTHEHFIYAKSKYASSDKLIEQTKKLNKAGEELMDAIQAYGCHHE
jgi:hypothetical protein